MMDFDIEIPNKRFCQICGQKEDVLQVTIKDDEYDYGICRFCIDIIKKRMDYLLKKGVER